MGERYFIDTSIWIDFYEDRIGYKDEPLGDYAFKLLAKIKAKESRIVISDFLIRELEIQYSMEQINGILKPFEKLIDKIFVTKSQKDEAIKISLERKVPKGDALHAIAARDDKLILITRDNHFRMLQDITKHYKPEELI